MADRHGAALDEVLAGLPEHGPCLLVVDDAELVDDAGGTLAALVAERRPGLLVVAAARADALRAAYGHWTAGVRRSHRGLVTTGGGDADGDLLGVGLPRRLPLAPRPGLVLAVADGECTLVQVALDDPAAASAASIVPGEPARGGRAARGTSIVIGA
jgi:S-DNA-T family DNA segregation ATPase FtsK/SpoIIIE